MARNARERIYVKRGRFYFDARDFADVGGGMEALIPDGDRSATMDRAIAEKIARDRLAELQQRKRNAVLLGVSRTTTLAAFAQYHLERKAESGQNVERWLVSVERHLTEAVAFFGAGRDLGSIGTDDVQRYVAHLAALPSGRGEGATLTPASQRKYLNSLSNLYRRAASEGYVPPGFNPAAALMEKPSGRTTREAGWLEVPEAALLLEAARGLKRAPVSKDRPPVAAIPFMHPLLATFLLTGGRKAEVLGLRVEDVSFDRGTVTFRPHDQRRLKTSTSHRTVPLWPQLREVLQGYLWGDNEPRVSGLLFPGRDGGLIVDFDKSLDAIAQRAGWNAGEVRSKALRHTYCAARLQTLDRGAPVSPWTVAKEMGHGGRSLVDRVYGHLGDVRHRAEVVEYRVEQHRAQLGERLAALGSRLHA